MTGFKIDLSKPEFSTQLEESELWQQAAWSNLFDMLDKAVDSAEIYKQQRKVSPNECAVYHNAIYVYGGRGSGKTVFLKNIKRRWEKQPDNKAKLHITDTIDPTLLQNHDSFAIVVVAQIYNEVEDYFKANQVDSDAKQTFYKTLKALADGMAQGDDLADHVGIDRIVKYRSGVQIENLFHEYIESACHALGSTAIALPIDDVDMALSKAFDVLDVVRRLLSCPLVVPIVSGDTNLYQQITELHFKKELKEASNGGDLARQLNRAYLTKIFPNQYRIGLVGVRDIFPSLSIEQGQTSRIYDKYQEALLDRYFYLTNGEERSRSWPEPETPREIQQLLSTIPMDQDGEKPNVEDWASFKQWAEQKQHGVAYSNAESVKSCGNLQLFNFDINKLIAFNPRLQKDTNFLWADKNYAQEQIDAVGRLSSDSEKKGNKKLVEAGLGDHYNVIRSMPPVELHTNSMTVPGAHSKKDSMILAVYTHRDYYTTMANTIAKVVFSRAFELLVASLLKFEIQDDSQWKTYLKGLLKRPPFYSIHAISPTKYVNDGNDDVEDESTKDGMHVDSMEVILKLASKMSTWQKDNENLLRRLKSEPSLLPLMHNVFNKVFSLLQLFKESGKVPVSGETLPDFIKRFEYIAVNAFATFLVKDKVIVKANTAQTKRLETIRVPDEFERRDRVFTRNVSHLLDIKTKEPLVEEDLGSQLLAAVWGHPIFDLHEEDNAEYLLEKRKADTSKDSSEKELSSETVNEIVVLAGSHQSKAIAKWAIKNQGAEEIEIALEKIENEIGGFSDKPNNRTKVMKVVNGLKQASKSGK